MVDTEDRGSPYAPHTAADTAALCEKLGIDSVEALFDIPEPVRFDGSFDLPARSERETREYVTDLLAANDELTELLGRGHYGYYVPSVVDHLADRSEFLTSYTQYQPETSQGFLQALFEYQSLLVELTGLDVANASMYDAATALGEAATLADRVRETDGNRVLVPETLRAAKRETLENYVAGTELVVDTYETADGTADLAGLEAATADDVVMLYAETPTLRGPIEPGLKSIGEIAHGVDALFVLGSDPVALSVLERPADVGADVVVGDASVLGLPTSYGMGLGLLAAREAFLRQLPGRLVGASTDETDRRAYTLTLQTREQHIRRERATSNICTNQAWVALRVAMHAALLGPGGLCELAERDHRASAELAENLDDISGVTAPVHDRHHLREFVCRLERDARPVADALADRGYAVHVVGDQELQCCVSGVPDAELAGAVAAFREVMP